MERRQKAAILKDLEKKIVFIVGPRQAGKTWLAKDIGRVFKNTVYLNYDNIPDRKIIETESWLNSTDLLILDELHKMPNWKNYLKGLYDTKNDQLKILVTGSARLDVFRQAGDSLAGRFFFHRLLPFSLAELQETKFQNDIERLLSRSGFPEPFLAWEDVEADRWRKQYIDGLIREDILNFDKIYDFKAIQLVLELLRTKVGLPISYSSIAKDVGIAPNTVKKYIQIFEALFIIFKVRPFSKNIARSLLKEPKIYFFDLGLVKGDEGILFENLVGLSLLKNLYYKEDNEGKNYSLHYIKTKEGKEIDFCVVREDKIESIIEVKNKDENLNKALLFFKQTYNYKAIKIVKNLKYEQIRQGIEIRQGINFLRNLEL